MLLQGLKIPVVNGDDLEETWVDPLLKVCQIEGIDNLTCRNYMAKIEMAGFQGHRDTLSSIF